MLGILGLSAGGSKLKLILEVACGRQNDLTHVCINQAQGPSFIVIAQIFIYQSLHLCGNSFEEGVPSSSELSFDFFQGTNLQMLSRFKAKCRIKNMACWVLRASDAKSKCVQGLRLCNLLME